MKKILCIMFSRALLLMWYSINIASENWQEGIITNKSGDTITVNKKTYNIDANTIIKDSLGNELSSDALGQESCCKNIKFLATNDYIKEIIVDTDKAVK